MDPYNPTTTPLSPFLGYYDYSEEHPSSAALGKTQPTAYTRHQATVTYPTDALYNFHSR